MRDWICGGAGVLGGLLSAAFGGWDAALSTLMLFMGADYLTGMLVAGVFHRSPKTPGGALESRAGWKGLIRKGITLVVVLAACRLDALLGTRFIRDGTVTAFVVNEAVSILENAGLMGVPIPPALARAVEVLRRRSEEEDRDE